MFILKVANCYPNLIITNWIKSVHFVCKTLGKCLASTTNIEFKEYIEKFTIKSYIL